ncbi:hypothetical protein D9758_006690 [Tetrapyrgos nigripes]|uniref:Saccharopine dehydrogenase NADP binding domain-containing protein n=1 Tax=Tetrapyrgos nigripes TaxID=182062 RepID=A0A8H5GJR6_9AGAR|nr:hypothetical protein D9758_006690 [Tetrapyrgos nigripes]
MLERISLIHKMKMKHLLVVYECKRHRLVNRRANNYSSFLPSPPLFFMSSKVDLLVLGATGVTGRQATRYLANHPEHSSFTLAIAARSKHKLDALVQEYSLPNSIQIFTVDVTNDQQVEEVVRNAKVVLNTVGPYYRWGTPVVRACARNGVHYVDLTGEPFWVREIVDTYDYSATKTGSIIVPACGVDSLPSDISIYVANKALKEASASSTSPLQVESSTTSWNVRGVMSYGTFHTLITSLELVPRKKLRESTTPYYLSPAIGRPSPRPRLLYKLFDPSTLQTHIGGLWFMKFSNQAIVERSWGILERNAASSAEPKQTAEAQKLRYGNKMVYDEFMRTPSSFAAGVVSLGIMFTMMMLQIGPIRWIAKKIGPQEGSGFSDEALEKGHFTTVNVTTAEASNTQAVVTLQGKGDPGYLLSPIMMADGALALLFNKSSIPTFARQGGVLTPATAFGDAIVERLQKNPRFSLKCEVVKDGMIDGKKVERRKDI